MASLEEALPLAELRRELRLRSAADDVLLVRHRAAAIAFVSRYIGRAIVSAADVEVRVPAPTGARDVVSFFVADPVAPDGALAVKYRAFSRGRGPSRPDSIDAGDKVAYRNRIDAWPPADGWPDWRLEAGFAVVVGVGVPAGDLEPEWGQAAVLVARELYEGNILDALPSQNVVERLLRNHVQWLGGPTE